MEPNSSKLTLSVEKPRCDGEVDEDSRAIRDAKQTTSENQDAEYLVVKIKSNVAQVGRNVSIIFTNKSEIQPKNTNFMLGDNEERSTDENNEGLVL